MKNILFIVITILIFSCNKSHVYKEKNSNVKSDHITLKKKTTKPKYITYEIVKNMPYEEIIKQYPPLYADEFLLSNGETEFRAKLYQSIPKEQWNRNIKIKEITWEISDKGNLTVWYKVKNNKCNIISYFTWNNEWVF